MDLKLIHFYPDLMSLYGSYGNTALLERHLSDLGNRVTVETVRPGADPSSLVDADFLFMGAGTERSQRAAMEDFSHYAADIRAAAEDGVAMLFAGTAMELLGRTITTSAGETYNGVGVGEFTSVQGARRIVGDVYGVTALYTPAVVGFINKCAVISGIDSPLLTSLSMGFGNEREGGPEGFHRGNVFASELTGPLLVKNPLMLGAVIAAIYARRGTPLPLEILSYPQEEIAYAITAQQLKLRAESGK